MPLPSVAGLMAGGIALLLQNRKKCSMQYIGSRATTGRIQTTREEETRSYWLVVVMVVVLIDEVGRDERDKKVMHAHDPEMVQIAK